MTKHRREEHLMGANNRANQNTLETRIDARTHGVQSYRTV